MICPVCDGEGEILVCCDDMCHGIGYCIHGDGMVTCHRCMGEGEIDNTSEDYDDAD